MPENSSNTQVGLERRRPVRTVAFVFVVASMLGAVAWGAAQGQRSFGHVRISADAGAQEWRGEASAVLVGTSLRVSMVDDAQRVSIELPWPSGVAQVVSARVTSGGQVGEGHVELEEAGAFVSGRFDAVLADGSEASGGWRVAMPGVSADSSAIAAR